MKKAITRTALLQFVAVSAVPLLFLTTIWLLTLGSFNLLEAVHSNACMVFTGVTTIISGIMFLITSQDNWD